MPDTEQPVAFLGYWKITYMETWAQHYVDLVVPGFIEFTYEDDLLMGRFQFGTVSGGLDCRLRDLDGAIGIEWSWQGQSDTDPGCGRGWVRLVDGELVGHLFIHCADDSAFRATKQPRPSERPNRARTREIEEAAFALTIRVCEPTLVERASKADRYRIERISGDQTQPSSFRHLRAVASTILRLG